MANLLEILENLVSYIPNFYFLFYVVSFMLGCVFAIKGLMLAGKRSEMGKQSGSWGAPMAMFATGALFVAIPGLMTTLRITFWEGSAAASPSSIFAHADTVTSGFAGTPEAQALIVAITTVIQFIGIIGVARGLHLMNMSAQGGQGPKTFGPGMTFIIAGAMAANFPLFMGTVQDLVTVVPEATEEASE